MYSKENETELRTLREGIILYNTYNIANFQIFGQFFPVV